MKAREWDGDEGGKIGILMSNVTQRSAAFKALQEPSASNAVREDERALQHGKIAPHRSAAQARDSSESPYRGI